MADIITGTTTGFVNNMPEQTYASVSDVRREAAEHTNEVVREGLKGDYATQKAITDLERANSTQIDMMEDVVISQFSTVGRDTADLRAQVTGIGYQVRDGFATAAKDAEINALKTQIEASKNTAYLGDKIASEGEKTRALINEARYADLNRALIERNAELVDERFGHRHWRGMWDAAQFQAVSNRVQALDSQLSETRQGLINFGTMAGVGQSSSTNNVK